MFAIQVVELCGQCFDQLFFLCFETIAAVHFFKAHNPSLDWILQSILDVREPNGAIPRRATPSGLVRKCSHWRAVAH